MLNCDDLNLTIDSIQIVLRVRIALFLFICGAKNVAKLHSYLYFICGGNSQELSS